MTREDKLDASAMLAAIIVLAFSVVFSYWMGYDRGRTACWNLARDARNEESTAWRSWVDTCEEKMERCCNRNPPTALEAEVE